MRIHGDSLMAASILYIHYLQLELVLMLLYTYVEYKKLDKKGKEVILQMSIHWIEGI